MYSKFKIQGSKFEKGYTLLELIITLTVLSILVMGTIPLVQNGVKRQKELRLRQTLRDVRNAIDEFKRDTLGSCPQGAGGGISGGATNPANPTQQQNVPADPRSRVVIDDCTIFTVDNLDRYPPSLDSLVEGVKVKPRGLPASAIGGAGLGGDTRNATDLNDTESKTKVYLREMPIDPFTGKSDWRLRSSFQGEDSGSWDQINVFDIRSNSDGEALNGEKYSDW